MPQFEAYHGRTGQEHQQAFDRLSGAGFRMIALSVFGDPRDARYNAVWVYRGNGDFEAFHGVADADYQVRFDQAVAKGLVPVLVAATGAGTSAIFAAVFEPSSGGGWMARHGLTRSAFEAADAQAAAAGLALRSFCVYGSAGAETFAGIWHPRGGASFSRLRALSAADRYQAVFDAESTLPYARAAQVAVGPGFQLGVVFRNDVVGRWFARHGLSPSEYQQEFDRQVAQGLIPVSVSAAGSAGDARYAAVFAEHDTPLPRQWSSAGRGADASGGSEEQLRTFMQRHGIRAAQFAVARNGRLLVDRAFTWSEPGTRQTGVRDRMLLASNSKLFVAAAVQWLYDSGQLTPSQQAFAILGFSSPLDPQSDNVTIQQLLDHTAGFANNPSDATYDMRRIARDLKLSRPPTALEVARSVYDTRMLASAPGTVSAYSNIGYLVAAAVVEQVSNQRFLDFVRQRLLAPLELTDLDQCPTAGPGGRPADQVVPEDDGLGLSTLLPQTDLEVAAVFGGDGMYKESTPGSCGLAASASTLARFIGTHAVIGSGGRTVGRRYGSTPGCRSAAVSKANGVDWALIINCRVGVDDAAWNALVDAIDSALDG